MSLDLHAIRQQFPSLDRPAIFLDNPAGTQISKPSLDRINRYLLENNANHEGMFETSRRSDEVLHEAHAAMADFLNASRPEEIIFGNNMTTLTLHMSRSLARNLQAGDNILVTRLDHDANIAPWMLVAEDKGCNLLWVDIDVEDGTLDLDDFAESAGEETEDRGVRVCVEFIGDGEPGEEVDARWHMMRARWSISTRCSTRRMVRLMCRILDVISSYARVINFSVHMRGRCMGSMIC